jgi:nicotinate-nucleotide adenylyltransferase
MKIAVLGGSFNPPHICHLLACYYVLATTDVAQVWLVPCYKHAFGKELASFQHRFSMCSLAVETICADRVKVSAVEEERQGTSWTVETVRYLQAAYPEHEFTWVIGSDVVEELPHWKDFAQLQQLITFLVVPRAGVEQSSAASDFQLPNVSSTLVRERIRQHQSIDQLVPKNVATYITTHNLYKV